MAKKSHDDGEQKQEPDKRVTLGLRFPPKLLAAMRKLARRNRRTITTQMEIAWENNLREEAPDLWAEFAGDSEEDT